MAVESVATAIRPIRLAHSAAWNLFGLGSPILLALVCIPILIRNLGLERFGLLSVLWTVVGYAGLFDLGLSRTLNLEVSRRIGESRTASLRHAVRTGVVALGIVGLAFGLLCLLSASALASHIKASASIETELVASLELLGFAIPMAVVNSGLSGTLEALGRFDQSNVVRVVVAAITFGASAVASTHAPSLVVAAATLLAARTVALALILSYVHRAMSPFQIPAPVTVRDVRSFLHSGRWLMAGNVLSPALAYGDRLVVTFIVPAASIAFYTTPYELVTKVLITASAVSNSLFPAVSRHAGNPSELRRLLLRSIGLVALAVVPALAVAAAAARPGLALWVSPEFSAGAVRVAQILCIGVLFNSFGALAFSTLQGLGRARVIVGLHLVELPVYVSALIAAAHFGGVLAVAATWSMRMLVDAVALWTIVLLAWARMQARSPAT